MRKTTIKKVTERKEIKKIFTKIKKENLRKEREEKES